MCFIGKLYNFCVHGGLRGAFRRSRLVAFCGAASADLVVPNDVGSNASFCQPGVELAAGAQAGVLVRRRGCGAVQQAFLPDLVVARDSGGDHGGGGGGQIVGARAGAAGVFPATRWLLLFAVGLGVAVGTVAGVAANYVFSPLFAGGDAGVAGSGGGGS